MSGANMGSLRPLVEPECGQANALVRLGAHLLNEPHNQRSTPLPSSSRQLQAHEQVIC